MSKKIIVVMLVSVFLFIAAASADAACSLVSGKAYYTDSVSYFKDSACRQEMTSAELNAGTSGSSISGGAGASTGYGNCRYSTARQQYTDGTAFFTDNKCINEAVNGETVAAPTIQATVATTAAVPLASLGTSALGASQYTQLTQRIAALETRVAALQSILAQVLALLIKK